MNEPFLRKTSSRPIFRHVLQTAKKISFERAAIPPIILSAPRQLSSAYAQPDPTTPRTSLCLSHQPPRNATHHPPSTLPAHMYTLIPFEIFEAPTTPAFVKFQQRHYAVWSKSNKFCYHVVVSNSHHAPPPAPYPGSTRLVHLAGCFGAGCGLLPHNVITVKKLLSSDIILSCLNLSIICGSIPHLPTVFRSHKINF